MEDFHQKNSAFEVLISMALFIIHKKLTTLYNRLGFKDLDYWMFELFIISYINKRMFKSNIYRHKKCAIFFNTIICSTLKLTSFLISFSSKKSNYPYKEFKWLIPIGILSYFLIIFCRSYSISKMKYLMDLRYISKTKLLLACGLLGTIISIVICSISTLVECTPTDIKWSLCSISNSNYDDKIASQTGKYYENFNIYFKTMFGKILNENYSIAEIFIEIFLTFCGMVTNFFYISFYIYVIRVLNPVYVIFSHSIYYILLYIILIINNLILSNKLFIGEKNEINQLKFIIDFLSNFFAIFGFLIYLEIIELNFCGLNDNLSKNISKRALDDLDENKDDESNSSNILEEEN